MIRGSQIPCKPTTNCLTSASVFIASLLAPPPQPLVDMHKYNYKPTPIQELRKKQTSIGLYYRQKSHVPLIRLDRLVQASHLHEPIAKRNDNHQCK